MTATWTVLVCGDRASGDDGAASAAVERLPRRLRSEVRIRSCSELQPGELVSALLSGPCLVLDTVEGVAPGAVISLPLAELLTGGSPNLRSSHAIAMPLVVRLAAAVGAPLAAGTFLGIGGSAYHAAGPLSRDVDAALDGYVAAIVTHLRPGTPARRVSRRRRPAAKPLRG